MDGSLQKTYFKETAEAGAAGTNEAHTGQPFQERCCAQEVG